MNNMYLVQTDLSMGTTLLKVVSLLTMGLNFKQERVKTKNEIK